jgi:hypothetical protein
MQQSHWKLIHENICRQIMLALSWNGFKEKKRTTS